MRRNNSAQIAPYVFITPFLISLVLFYLYPVTSTVIMSFQELVPGSAKFIGLENYRRLWNPDFQAALWNSLRYTVYTIAILIPMPMVLAVMLNRGSVRINSLYRAFLFMPSLVSVVVAGTVIRLLFAQSPQGFVNTIVGFFGVEPQQWLLGGPSQAMVLLLSLAVWRWTGVNIVYFLSGLQNIPGELYEAAEIDGASSFQRFRRITVPMLKPTTIFVTTISIFGGFAMFEESFILWSGKPSPNNTGLTMVGYIYDKGFQQGLLGMGSAIGIVLFLIVFSLSLVLLKSFGFFDTEGSR